MKHILTKWPTFMILQLCLTKGNERTLCFHDTSTVLAQLDSMALDRTLLKSVAGQALFSLITDFRALQIDKTEAEILESIVFNAAGRRNMMILWVTLLSDGFQEWQFTILTGHRFDPAHLRSMDNSSYLSMARHHLTTFKNTRDTMRLTKIILLVNSIYDTSTQEALVNALFENRTIQVTHFVHYVTTSLILSLYNDNWIQYLYFQDVCYPIKIAYFIFVEVYNRGLNNSLKLLIYNNYSI